MAGAKVIKKAVAVKKEVVKEAVKGVPDIEEKAKPSKTVPIVEGKRRIGLSKGLTINMGDFQSARIDFWMEREVPDNDRDCEKAVIEMSETIDAFIEEEADKLK